MSIPEWIYFAMGAVIARIMLDGTKTKGYRPLDWLQLVFNISRIVILWPLVLFVEKIEAWLKHEPQAAANVMKEEQIVVKAVTESRLIDSANQMAAELLAAEALAVDGNETGGKA
jgi:hypothetical protein